MTWTAQIKPEKKPMFYPKHWTEIAQLIADLPEKDEVVQAICIKFGLLFERDNPKFDFRRWQSYLTRRREDRQNGRY